MTNWKQPKSLFNPEKNLTMKAHIPKQKVPSFIKLYFLISELVGSKVLASKEIGVGLSTMGRMELDKKLSVDTAKKILACYKRMFNEDA